ncbi:nitrous oxide reductase accessory protein NosL [Halorhabdus sp. CUG00001]|uniref:nitrous oxide reductase accessory protein NosL n=1 Tax=Halorhabdus sp. CUG00001 TaxID=2600297 RepID=UPI00131E153F|nr:nitrous oxide reductase accessory protein NosL [Halorhabdus sp. CUG00001]
MRKAESVIEWGQDLVADVHQASVRSPANGPQTGTQHSSLTRRRVVKLAGAGTAVGLAGCLSAETPAPVALTDGDACDVCGMVIPHHPGPSAEVFYRNKDPSGHENPARFDSTWEAFEYDFQRLDRGWTRAAFYVTDYAAVDYEIFSEGERTLISTHPEAAAFTLAEDVTFVVDSRVEGAMGRDLIGFGTDEAARAFQDEYGGSLATFDDVTRSMIAGLAQR